MEFEIEVAVEFIAALIPAIAFTAGAGIEGIVGIAGRDGIDGIDGIEDMRFWAVAETEIAE